MRILKILAMLLLTAVIVPAYAAKKDEEKKPPANSIDAATGKILTEAIEALNKEFASHILVSGATRERLRDPVPLQALPAVRVKGRSAEVEVYRLA